MMELAEAVGPEAKVLLLKGLGDDEASVRAAAAKALDEHDGPEVVEGLVRSLEDADAEVRRTAAETLSEKKEPACGPLLIERADHADPFVQAAALRALRELVLPDALAAAVHATASLPDTLDNLIHAAGIVGLHLRAGLGWHAAATVDGAFWIGDLIKLAATVLVAGAVHRAFPDLLRRRA